MAETYTTNKALAMVTVGTDAGTWGPFVNLNPQLLDNMLGGTATIALTNANVILSSAQYQCNFITFTGALSGNCVITFPAVGSFYTVQNLTSNTSAFQVTLANAGAGQQIGCPWGEAVDIMTDATNVKFRNLGRIGSYWDHAGSSVPAWVSNCTVPPYLYCNGATFSSAVYPVLTTIFNSTTLPDFRGRGPIYLNDGTGRVTAAGGGVDGNTLFAAGGAQTTTLSSQQMPNYALPVTDPTHTHNMPNLNNPPVGGTTSFAANGYAAGFSATTAQSAATGISVNSGGGGLAFSNVQPAAISGIRMVRAG